MEYDSVQYTPLLYSVHVGIQCGIDIIEWNMIVYSIHCYYIVYMSIYSVEYDIIEWNMVVYSIHCCYTVYMSVYSVEYDSVQYTVLLYSVHHHHSMSIYGVEYASKQCTCRYTLWNMTLSSGI